MAIKDSFLSEFDQEMAITRRCLERVPYEKVDWKPHPRAGTLGWLAWFTGLLPGWGTSILQQDSFDLAGAGQQAAPPVPKNVSELLSSFDKGVTECRAALAAATDEQMMRPWALLKGGEKIFTLPRVAVFRGMVMNHIIHHRGQLTVYLRMLDVKVPSIYGPSADEQVF
jgi:uncharacterized damage-inducible protein DinB